MYKSYFKIGWRNLIRNKGYSFINIGGLAMGITVAMFIGLWIHDELSFNKYHKNYDEIAQVWGGSTNPETFNIEGGIVLEYPIASALQDNYPQYFKHVLRAWWIEDHTVSSKDNKFTMQGEFIDGGVIQMLTLKMIKGTINSLDDRHSIILSRSTALAFFGDEDPVNKSLKIDGRLDVQVTGVYEDIPKNNEFGDVQFFSPWSLWEMSNDWIKRCEGDWTTISFATYVQLHPDVTLDGVNAAIKDFYHKNAPSDFYKTIEKNKPFLQVVPMSKWHLYSEFKNGQPSGGLITVVWQVGIIGAFVLLLACINFINLSTARSAKRAREVGIRKAIGSVRWQLITQFLSESFIVVVFAFVICLLSVTLLRDSFNQLADKDISLPFNNYKFWIIALIFITVTGLLAGLYPAFYLSSFQPVKVLKGTIRPGRFAALPRKLLIILQFTVSVVLITGTVIVYQQIQHAQNRPIGYNNKGIISLEMNDPDYKGKQEVLKSEFLNSGVVSSVAFSSNPLTAIWSTVGGFTWEGEDPNTNSYFRICDVTHDYGKTASWQIVSGRDFTPDVITDSTSAVIINESAVRYTGFKDPIGKELVALNEFGIPLRSWIIIGVVKDMVMESPYEQVKQTLYYVNKNASNIMHIRFTPEAAMSEALPRIKASLEKVVPSALFDYKFVDEEYARKFSQEQRIGNLSAIFAMLAILISCLGLFGLASYVSEQRTKEIGIRKVLGATVSNLWSMLTREFIVLVIIGCVIAFPIGYFLMSSWLEKYEYRTEISWWIFLATGIAALIITLLTVSYQSIKAATMNPVKSLKSE